MDLLYEEFDHCLGHNCLASSCPDCLKSLLVPVADLVSAPYPPSMDDVVFDPALSSMDDVVVDPALPSMDNLVFDPALSSMESLVFDPALSSMDDVVFDPALSSMDDLVFNLDPSFMDDIDFDPDPVLPSSPIDSSDSAGPSGRSPSIASSYGSAEQTTKELTECNSSSVEPLTSPRETDIDEPDSKHARDHPMYRAAPGTDLLYHCPFEAEPDCEHKPTRLKCHYDKYVDSHLRPFKCKDIICAGARFSSTACLRRHERESHGMHGHGSRPHLCIFPRCDRAAAGKGFPRRYNLLDHMKRVHHLVVQFVSNDASSDPGASDKGVRPKRKALDRSAGRK